MLDKKIQENPLPRPEESQPEIPQDRPAMPKEPEKVSPPVPVPVVVPAQSPRLTIPSFTKTPPNELYRRLLPAVLFLLTFVTVMTILLIYMDTVALGAQQFRLNMSRDYELARIGQASAPLVAYVRQLHLAPRAPRQPPPPPLLTERVKLLDSLYGEIYNGTFVEWLPRGGREPTAWYLEHARGWRGLAVRAAPRDFLALRGAARALHACLSPTAHPREVTYQEEGDGALAFRSRVLCLPLYTVLLAGDATRATYTLLAGDVFLALTHLPFHQDDVHLQVLDIRFTDPIARNKTTNFLLGKNYTVAATYDDGIMYTLKD